MTNRSPRRHRRGFRVLLGLGLVGALGAGVAVAAGPHGGGFGHRGPMGGHSPERMARVVDHVLDDVDATDDQKAQVKTILEETHDELGAVHADGQALHERLGDELSAASVDEVALEGLRQEALALVDRGTAEAMDAVVAISQVLTAEQRVELVEEVRRRGPGRR